MKQEYRQAFTEVDTVLQTMPISLLNKIPIEFRNLVKSEKDTEYKFDVSESFDKQELKEETIIILGLIYRDFLCSDEEREKLKLKEAEKIQKEEEELRKKYNVDNIFKKKEENVKQGEEKGITTVAEESWYKKFFNIIKKLFNKKIQ